jgi:glucose-6-phosphate dehydrogenase assembly protein OpcA
METKQNIATANIQAELKSLWKAPSAGGITKACLFNLIVYTQEPRRTNYFKEVVKMIMEQFPCRIIFIQGDQFSSDPYLNVHVSVEKSQTEHEIACDQVFIEAGGEDINRVPFLILPLFISDLPVYLLWGQDPTTENAILPHLQRFATRLIFDSESTEDLQHFSEDILKRLATHSLQIVDMNWARIGGWREVLAQTFDSPERLEQLANSHLIQIVYNNLCNEFFMHPETQAVYLQAWLASRLGWQFKSIETQDHAHIIHYQSAQATPSIQLIPKTQQNYAPEDILEFKVSAPQDYVCDLKRLSQNQVEGHASTQFQCELPFTLFMPTLQSGRSFMQEIFYQKISEHYAPMLELIRLAKWS